MSVATTTETLANDKFTRRFQRVESLLRERGKSPSESTLEEMDALWDQAKAEERRGVERHDVLI